MIIRKADPNAPFAASRISELGGIHQFGAYVTTLAPGESASDEHWHEHEDEMLFMLVGEATVIEDAEEHMLGPGDSACWPKGTGVAHTVQNRSESPCTYLIIGTRVPRDVVHYPKLGRTLYIDGHVWRLVDGEGQVLKEGVDSEGLDYGPWAD